MQDYLTLIRKSDFTDLFKFGYLYINKDRVVEFDGNVETLPNNDSIKNKLFAHPNPFDYSFTFLVIHFKNDLNEYGRLNIEDVQNIFALDDEAKREIEISYDSRIKINPPLWHDIFRTLQIRFLIEDAKKGALNIWHILKVNTPIENVSNILSDKDIHEIIEEVVNDRRPVGNLSFWVYLLRYERHGFFPKNTLGCFYDIINVFINTYKQQECQSEIIESTEIFHYLEKATDPASIINIIEYLNSQEIGRNFLNKVNNLSENIFNASVVAVLFLLFKQLFINNFKLDENAQKSINYATVHFPHETPFALFLFGIYLGNNHTFETLYDELPLAIFKKQEDVKLQVVNEPMNSNNFEVEPVKQEEQYEQKLPNRVYNDNHIDGLSKWKKVKSIEDLNIFISQGYVNREA